MSYFHILLQMLNEGLQQPNLAWINDTHWVDHPITSKFKLPTSEVSLDLVSESDKVSLSKIDIKIYVFNG